jgi:hypothetical protein
MKNQLLSAIACGILLFAACKKDDTTPNNNNNNNTSKKDLIVGGKWQWTGLAMVYSNNGKDSLVDAWSEVKDCDKDDSYTFATDGTGIVEENATKCSDDPQTENITWKLINNETQVEVTDDKGPSILTIIELTATKAVYDQRVSVGSDSVTVRQSFKNIK